MLREQGAEPFGGQVLWAWFLREALVKGERPGQKEVPGGAVRVPKVTELMERGKVFLSPGKACEGDFWTNEDYVFFLFCAR